jgi:small-conductance mechanosensitive channel
VLAAILAVIPYVLSLDSLGRVALRVSQATLVTVCIASALCGVTGWALKGAGAGRLVARRAIQGGIVLVVLAANRTLWMGLLRDVFMSPDAPKPVQTLGAFGVASWTCVVAFWNKGMFGGMTVASFSKGVCVFALSFWIARLAKHMFMERVLSRTPMDESTRQTFGAVLGYLIIVTGFLVALNVAGSSLKNLALLAGAITVGLGFGLQNVINNFVSSLMIHFGRAIRVGDYIEVGGQRGTVQEIGLRSTRLFTDDGINLLVPNGTFVTTNIINWTNPRRSVRLRVPFSVLRAADMPAAIDAVTAVALAHPQVQKRPAPVVETRSATADRINMELLAWTNKPQLLPTIVGELNLSTDKALREKGFC